MAASSHGKSSGGQAKRPATPSSTEADSESETEYTASSDGTDAESLRPPVKKVAATHAERSTIFVENLPDDKYAQAVGARMQKKKQQRRRQASDADSSSGKGEDTPSETDTDGGVDTPSESEEGSTVESKNGVRGRQQSASGAKSGPSKSASTSKRPSRSQPLEQATNDGRRRWSPDRDLEKGRSNGWRDDNDDGGCCGCGICACLGCWDEVTNWRLWSWLRRRSAYMIAGLAGLGMVAAGGTGVNGQWTFISVNGYNLGGLGYCQGGTCTTGVIYDIDVSTSAIFLSTRVLSGLLLSLAVNGTLLLSLLLYLFLSTTCFSADTFRPPHRVFLRCFFSAVNDSESRNPQKLERKAQFENGLSEGKWGDKSEREQRRMISQVKMKDCFQSWMFWVTWPVGGIIVIALYAWKEAVDAEETFVYEMTLYGGMANLVLYAIFVQVYRSNVRGYSKDLWENSAQLREEAMKAMSEGKDRIRQAGRSTGKGAEQAVRSRMTPEGRRAAGRGRSG